MKIRNETRVKSSWLSHRRQNMRKMQILRVSLIDYTVREAIRKVEEYLREGKLHTIAYISKKGVMEADENQQVKEFIEKMDMMLCADSDLLRAANVESWNRIREIDENLFMEEFLKKMIRQRKNLYILAQTQVELLQLEEHLRSYQENLNIVGRYALEHLSVDEEFVVNEINGLEPDVLVSYLPSMKRIEFYDSNCMKINVNIWLMLKDDVVLHNKNKGLIRKISDRFLRGVFKKKTKQYHNENGIDEV